MFRRSTRTVFLLLFLMPAALVAQSSRFNGIWVAPTLSAAGPGFYTFTLNVTGDTLTGSVNDTGRGNEAVTGGRIENGHISFALPKFEHGGVTLEKSYTGTLKDDKHLDLVQESRTSGVKLTRKAGSKAPLNTLEGEWGSDLQSTVFHVQGETLSGELNDHFLLALDDVLLVNVPQHHAFTDGEVHGNSFSYRFKNKNNNPVTCTGTIMKDTLVLNCATKAPLHAVWIAEKQN